MYLLRQLQREEELKLASLQANLEASMAEHVPGDEEDNIFKHHQKQVKQHLTQYLKSSAPYVDWDKHREQAEKDEAVSAQETWENEFGSLDDPDVQAENERLAEHLRQGGDAGFDESAPEPEQGM